MKSFRLLVVALLVVVVAATSFAAGAGEEEFPSEAVTVIVPYRAGGGMDTTARTMASVSEEYLGVPLVVVNRTGGAGTIATVEASRAEPDGYTLLMVDIGVLAVTPLTQDVQYALSDFDAVSGVNVNDIILVVPADSPYQTADDLAEADERVRYGTTGRGSILHAIATAFIDQTGIEATNVPFGSTADTVNAVLGGNIDVGVAHPNQARTGLADGTLRAIGVFSNERVEALPDVPTMVEQGYPIAQQLYNVVLGPAGVPEDRLEVLREAFVGMLNDPVVTGNAANRNLVLWPESGETVGPQLLTDAAAIAQTFRELGVVE